jgi:glutamyl-tRNA reductase
MHLYAKQEREVVEHLFNVTASLDSMVLGETQILGQVRNGYDIAREARSAGAMLNPLFQHAIAVGKEVMSQTPLSEGHLSIASVAVEYARRIFERFSDKTVLTIGAGEMAALVLQHFASLHPKRLIVCNRDVTKAEALAAQYHGEGVPFTSLDEHLAAADIVISSTGAGRPIIVRSQFESVLRKRRYRAVFLIDIAVPRDVDSAVAELEHVYLYNIDDLQQVVSTTQAQRSAAVEDARQIVVKHVEEFLAWHRRRALGPAIDQLYKRYHAVAHEEVERTLHKLSSQLSDHDRQQLDELARRIVNKLLHDPVKALKSPDAQHFVTPQYLHALQKLFQLDLASADNDDGRTGETGPDAPLPAPSERT